MITNICTEIRPNGSTYDMLSLKRLSTPSFSDCYIIKISVFLVTLLLHVSLCYTRGNVFDLITNNSTDQGYPKNDFVNNVQKSWAQKVWPNTFERKKENRSRKLPACAHQVIRKLDNPVFANASICSAVFSLRQSRVFVLTSSTAETTQSAKADLLPSVSHAKRNFSASDHYSFGEVKSPLYKASLATLRVSVHAPSGCCKARLNKLFINQKKQCYEVFN